MLLIATCCNCRAASIMNNVNSYMRCWAPDCGQLRRESPEADPASWYCDVCQTTTCPTCSKHYKEAVPAHLGMTCADNQTSRREAQSYDYSQDIKYSPCPGCGVLVEKESGCLHMSCSCGMHFCYGCGTAFGADGHGVYGHISTCNGPRSKC
jgi:hypothetical protein